MVTFYLKGTNTVDEIVDAITEGISYRLSVTKCEGDARSRDERWLPPISAYRDRDRW